jgi:alpha-L-rhamnosidase
MNVSRRTQKNSLKCRISRRDLLRSGVAASALMVTERTAFGSIFATLPAQPSGADTSVTLSCEWLAEPLGIQTAHPRLSWSYSEVDRGVRQTAYRIVVSSAPDGPADLWDSGRVDSADAAVLYRGTPLHTHQLAYWRVRTWLSNGTSLPWSAPARWSMGPQGEQDWGASRWIGRDDLRENTQDQMAGVPGLPPEPNFFPAPHLRKEFTVRGTVQSALLYVCGLGYAELHLNGRKIGDTERDPGFTNFDDRVLYVTHDVTTMLCPEANALGTILGTGWYDVHDVATWHFNTAPWRQRPRMRLLLAIHYFDGSSEVIASDESWRCAAGPILRDGIYTGEVYDARKELSGWSIASFDDSSWTQALLVKPPIGTLVPLMCEPIRITQDLAPVSITQPKPGIYIVDMGQNFSGHVQLRVKSPAGQAITMRYAEMLYDDGTLNSEPIDHLMEQTTPRQPFQQDTYISKGSGEEEVWEQRFSYSGFQYVEVAGFPGVPTTDNFRGRFAHTDMQRAGSFTCSDETMNRIQHATIWSYLSNAQSYPTDCPQREKNGWTGDGGLASECGLMNFHSANFYRKWLDDFADAQLGNLCIGA